MDMSEIPMILFTTLAQMCVGAFILLGVISILGSLRYSSRTVERFTDPAIFTIGPAMILGLAVSMLHMHDVTNTLNVLRHWNSSWLSREIIFGSAFAGAGFVFFVMQWRKWGPAWLRQLLAIVTALFGIGLLVSMANIYYSLVTVPAWHTWFTPFQFVATAFLLGSLLVAMAMVLFGKRLPTLPAKLARVEVGVDKTADAAKDAEADAMAPEAASLLSNATRGLLLVAILSAAAILIATPFHVAALATAGTLGAKAAAAYTGWLPVVRFVLLVLGTILLGVLAVGMASPKRATQGRLARIIIAAFVITLIAELLGRAVFYAQMFRVGI